MDDDMKTFLATMAMGMIILIFCMVCSGWFRALP